MKINNILIDTNKTNVMGILNLTEDSFYDGGSYTSLDKALFHCEQMIDDGAAIIDVGGESTRPGYIKISNEEEISRVVPVIEGIVKRFDIPLSVDTYKVEVAKEALKAGASMVNDIWGGRQSDEMLELVAKSHVAYCLMHNCESSFENYELVIDDLKSMLDKALLLGIEKESIILDPGVGFAKTKECELDCIAHIDEFKINGLPVLLGTSNKSCINYVTGAAIDKRLPGTLATTALAVMNKIEFVRVHDVKANVDFIKMYSNLLER